VLSNKWIDKSAVRAQRQPNYLYRYLSHLATKMIVAENRYTDRDYLDDYACFYVRSFEDYPRHTRRVHFFSEQLSPVELADVFAGSRDDLKDELMKSYNGFVVARPLPVAIVGRTILKPYEADGLGHDYPVTRAFPVTRAYEPNLFGIALPMKQSLAFQQQDTVVAACASVALWSAFHKTQRLFDSLRPSPSSVTRLANAVRGSGREMPSHSLTPEQMGQAILSVGLEPEYVEVNPDTPLSSLLYGYASMGIPVVLLVYMKDQKPGFHAVTVVGYAFPSEPREASSGQESHEPAGRIRYKARDTKWFYVHDDNIGPFAYMLIEQTPAESKDTAANGEAAEYFESAPYTLEAGWYEGDERRAIKCAPMVAIIPVDPLIRLTFLGLHKWLDYCVEIFENYTSELDADVAELVWDVRLQRTNDLKTEIRSIVKNCPLASTVLIKDYPLYIWRTTVAHQNVKLFDIFADASEVDTAFPFLDVLYHNEGFAARIRDVFGVSEMREIWAPVVGRKLVEFFATKGM
jgi:hypothetical protein